MGGALSSVFSIETCSCGTRSEEFKELQGRVEELKESIELLKTRIRDIDENTGALDSKIAELAVITAKMDSSIASLVHMVFDRLLVSPAPPTTPRVSFSDDA